MVVVRDVTSMPFYHTMGVVYISIVLSFPRRGYLLEVP